MSSQESNLEALFSLESQRTGIVEEPPFKILVLADLSGDADKRSPADRNLIEIDRDNYDAVIEKLGVALNIELDGIGFLRLQFRELDDFHPDNIFRNLPIFGELRDLRKQLKDENTFHSAAREVRERFGNVDDSGSDNEPAAAPQESDETPAEGLLDAILSKPSGGAAAPRSTSGATGEIADLVSRLVRPHLVNVDEDEQKQMVSAVDEATSELMRQILHNPRFQRLEATWRGLFFLIRRAETSSDLKIHVLDISKTEFLEDLAAAETLADTALYRHLVRDAIETPGEEPFAVILGDLDLDTAVADVAGLIRVGKLASAANAPFISSISPIFMGIDTISDSTDPANWKFADASEAGKLWAALTGQPEAEYLGMVMPRFLARLPYGADTDPLETFYFEEFTDGPKHDGYVWSSSCYAIGALLAQSFSEYGWEMGRALKQDIDGLPIHVYKDGTETIYKPGSEVLLTQTVCERLMDNGLMPLVTYKNTDRVKLARFQSIADTALKGMWAA
ncbi:MAG: type VI secretion system contractile sheath large subunit [Acidobacteria bacterium]|nr:type VI secretion system contractile sheath large subunit [Acidobacteriota bacterium]